MEVDFIKNIGRIYWGFFTHDFRFQRFLIIFLFSFMLFIVAFLKILIREKNLNIFDIEETFYKI